MNEWFAIADLVYHVFIIIINDISIKKHHKNRYTIRYTKLLKNSSSESKVSLADITLITRNNKNIIFFIL